VPSFESNDIKSITQLTGWLLVKPTGVNWFDEIIANDEIIKQASCPPNFLLFDKGLINWRKFMVLSNLRKAPILSFC
jgi:hypothetical protein